MQAVLFRFPSTGGIQAVYARTRYLGETKRIIVSIIKKIDRKQVKNLKLKAYQRDALMPLYKEHAMYLLRVLKTASNLIDIKDFAKRIPEWRERATCHEIAINNYGVVLQTHENKLGKEKEYTRHPAAKGVGRDARVRLIWDLVASAIEEDPTLETVKPYRDKQQILGHPWKGIKCPFCSEIYYSHVFERVVDGMHLDGTEDWHWMDIELQFSDFFDCDHLIAGSDTNTWLSSAFEEYVKPLLRGTKLTASLIDAICVGLEDAHLAESVWDDQWYFFFSVHAEDNMEKLKDNISFTIENYG